MKKLYSFIVRLIEAECSEAIAFECQAEDVDHAVEQAENAYPGCKVVTTLRNWKVGETTWWEDPDMGLSSGRYVVREIATESGAVDFDDAIVVIDNGVGTTAEVFPNELRTIPTLAELATEVSNSEASDGCAGGYTVVHAGHLRALLNEIRLGTPAEHAALFLKELLDSVETLTGIAEEHGPRTLADLVYLQAAILNDGFIDHYPGESRVPELVQRLPSGRLWMQYIKTE